MYDLITPPKLSQSLLAIKKHFFIDIFECDWLTLKSNWKQIIIVDELDIQ